MRNVALVTTMWGLVTPQAGKEREQELLRKDEFWGNMVRSGATCDRYDNTRKDGLRIVKALLQNIPCVLQIQEEMEGGVSLENTTAGREVNDRIKEIEAQYKKEIAELRQEMQRERNDRALEQLRKDHAIAHERLEEAARARERMHESTIRELQEQIYALQNRSYCVVM
jgi:hypothetical protein